jgi:hypothetical protein
MASSCYKRMGLSPASIAAIVIITTTIIYATASAPRRRQEVCTAQCTVCYIRLPVAAGAARLKQLFD